VTAQNYWSAHTSAARLVTDKSVARKSFPKDFKLFDLNINPLRKDLLSVVGNASKHTIIISIPNAQGKMEKFEMTEASNFRQAITGSFSGDKSFFRQRFNRQICYTKIEYFSAGYTNNGFQNGERK
jgi:hypothetical protein